MEDGTGGKRRCCDTPAYVNGIPGPHDESCLKYNRELDKCEVCHGKSGGIRGNENIVDGVIMCDYCTVKHMNIKKLQHELQRKNSD